MDERIEQIFQKHFDEMRELAERTQKVEYPYAMEELTDLYSEISGIPYDFVAAKLRGRDTNDED